MIEKGRYSEEAKREGKKEIVCVCVCVCAQSCMPNPSVITNA